MSLQGLQRILLLHLTSTWVNAAVCTTNTTSNADTFDLSLFQAMVLTAPGAYPLEAPPTNQTQASSYIVEYNTYKKTAGMTPLFSTFFFWGLGCFTQCGP